MTIRVGRIKRHEDVHGISGTGDHLAEVVEFSDGSCVVRWLGKDAMTNVAAGVKNVTNVHGHGGKTDIEWLWEQTAPPDPMEAVFEKKIVEAGGSTGTASTPTGPSAVADEAEKEAEAEAIADELVEEAADTIERVAGKVAAKLGEQIAEKTAEAAAEKAQVNGNGAEE
jgi:hypothetical protein